MNTMNVYLRFAALVIMASGLFLVAKPAHAFDFQCTGVCTGAFNACNDACKQLPRSQMIDCREQCSMTFETCIANCPPV
jgi:hypothetical protein